jgi:hypothetical protein
VEERVHGIARMGESAIVGDKVWSVVGGQREPVVDKKVAKKNIRMREGRRCRSW